MTEQGDQRDRRDRDQRDQRDHKGRTRSGARGAGGPRRVYSGQRPSERSRTADAPRLAAYTVLREVADGGYANLALPRLLREQQLHGRDAAFATELTYGTLRWRGFYDAVIARSTERPLDQVDPAVLDTLRLGAHQVLAMRVPVHAAVSETVGLARMVNGAGASGFVNAVLRKVSESSREEWLDRVGADDTAPDHLAARWSHPEWIVRALRGALIGHGVATGADVDAQLVRLLEADNTPAEVSLVARPGLATVAELVDLGAVASEVSPIGATLPSGDPGELPPVRRGRAAVQDAGSQLLPLVLAAAPVEDPREHEGWLDLCAGPGGKAGVLAGLSLERGATLIANEVSRHRAELVQATVREAVERGADVEVQVGDGRHVGEDEPGVYDRVLVDAPCTGLGALRRRPDARWRRESGDVPVLASLQRELLNSALDATRPGGVVGYATCSPHLNETEYVVKDVLKHRDDASWLDARPVLAEVAPGVEVAGEGPALQLWPHQHGTDAMYLALLRKH